MKWLLFTEVFVTVLYLTSAYDPASEFYATGCASIGYNTSCCPASLGVGCEAVDTSGYYCRCDASCHTFDDCCEDVHCTPEPRTCAEVGITSCCYDETGSGLCDVHFRDAEHNRCSCNLSCHLRDDCCSDASRIGCNPHTCTEAGKDPGCCVFSSSNICYVRQNGKDCYCDSSCIVWNDCCEDVIFSVAEQCVNSLLARSRIQSQRGHTIESSTIRRYNENERRTRVQTQANFREAQATHVPRPRARMNRVRARPSSGYRRRPVR